MANAEELRKFLQKRGFNTEVKKVNETFTIGVSCKTVEEVTNVLGYPDGNNLL